MFLFILESIGTSELLLIGVIALIFLGPRRMPEMARKIGKIMAEFRGTANEFKQTWQREVDFEEEAKAVDLNNIEREAAGADRTLAATSPENTDAAAPQIRPVDPARLEELKAKAAASSDAGTSPPANDPNSKQNWL